MIHPVMLYFANSEMPMTIKGVERNHYRSGVTFTRPAWQYTDRAIQQRTGRML